jgi:hypothetical protein
MPKPWHAHGNSTYLGGHFYPNLAQVGKTLWLGSLPCSGSSSLLIDLVRAARTYAPPEAVIQWAYPASEGNLLRREHGLV